MNIRTRSLWALIMVVAIVAFAYFAIWPKWGEIKQSRNELTSATEQQKKLIDTQRQIDSFVSTFKSSQEGVAKANLALPVNSKDLHNLLLNLDDMAKQSGLSLAELKFTEKSESELKLIPPNTILTQEVSMDASGAFAGFKNFLQLLETNMRLIDVKEVSFDVGETGQSEYRLKFVIYYQN